MSIRAVLVSPSGADEEQVAHLDGDGFAVSRAPTLAHAVRSVVAGEADLVLVFARDEGAADQCAVLRALGDVPLALATEGVSDASVARSLDAGADMAIALPCASRELAARLRALARRVAAASGASAPRWRSGDLTLDLDARVVSRRGVEVSLSPTEFNLLAVLAEQPGRVVTSRELLTRVWGPEYADDVQYVRLYIGYLRSKLEENPRQPTVILNHWGVGYRLSTGDSHPDAGVPEAHQSAPLTAAR